MLAGQFDGAERNLRPSELRGVERYTTGALHECHKTSKQIPIESCSCVNETPCGYQTPVSIPTSVGLVDDSEDVLDSRG